VPHSKRLAPVRGVATPVPEPPGVVREGHFHRRLHSARPRRMRMWAAPKAPRLDRAAGARRSMKGCRRTSPAWPESARRSLRRRCSRPPSRPASRASTRAVLLRVPGRVRGLLLSCGSADRLPSAQVKAIALRL